MESPFKDDRDFLNYVSLHSTTERALFSNRHVARFLRLAGDESLAQPADANPGGFSAMHYEIIDDMLKAAYARLPS